MKRYWVLCLLFVTSVLAEDGQTNGPAQTPEELGKRVAQAMIAGDTNSLAVLIPSYEAYLPMCRLNLGEGPYTEANLQKYYARWLGRLTEEVQAFPSEFAKATSFKADQIDRVDVVRQKAGSRTNWTDVEVIFSVKDVKFLLNLDECLRFSNAWYLVDLDWMGRQE